MAASLTLNEIRSRALAFSKEWKGESSESAEKQTFWNQFFEIFGISRRRYAHFEVPVQLRDRKRGRIDVFWPGLLLIEHKSAGEGLTAAFKQATDYFDGIEEEDLPRYVVVSDFAKFRLYKLDSEIDPVEFPLESLHTHISHFGFLTGHTYRQYDDAPEVSVKAAQLMAALHNDLRRNGYAGQPLAVFLVRLMFCLFADHTGLFPRNLFRDIIERKTHKNGGDVGSRLAEIFAVLDQIESKRQTHLDDDLKSFPYVNGHLFQERFDPPAFDSAARKTLLKCCSFDWSGVSPAIFGAMFQMVMDEVAGARRGIGAHYTSEKNILKTVGPLLIEPLRADYEKANSKAALEKLLERIRHITVLDPACGCGNFLVIAYRELRQLEIDINRKLQKFTRLDQKALSVLFSQGIEVDAMYGIEIEEFPCRVAETALYLIDHLMNMKASEEFGENFIRLPLRKTPHITQGNAMRIDWASVIPVEKLTCIVGNPPFVGKGMRSAQQAEDMDLAFGDLDKHGELDYVACWYVKALDLIKGTTIPVAFVSTNSLTQGEQVAILWPRLLQSDVKIRFAHRTFRWTNEAPGQAAVYCVIIGWSLEEPKQCQLFEYATPKSEPMVQRVKRINPYLVDADDVYITSRRKPLCSVPPISFGSMPNDAGNFLFTEGERKRFLQEEPEAKELFRRVISAKEFINGIPRYCLWLKDAQPSLLRSLPKVKERIENVKRYRLASKRPATQRLAETPSLFGEIRQPSAPYIIIPRVSSEHRRVIPMAIFSQQFIASDTCVVVHSRDLYHFGVLQSTMHMAWVRQVCGRLESRYRYSNEIVYNNFPWPDKPAEKRQEAVRKAAQHLLDIRLERKDQSLAHLYDPDVMPPELIEAHRELDQAVDACYRPQSFENELARIRFLFERLIALTTADQLPIVEEEPRRLRRRR